ncbi:NanoRNase/pAp phosphatase [Pseudobythopirellula maris]|uniref:NanoRNase/pAp phosphatase n=1 Tax=Pseudobythopirellula maris TaxID=2527991 RepID=A0A5C5ZQM9_9BACT|nr:bifunctional oligoribonuclease/PAP phosphatase NrnA [Pseudobythopirellula maris]TWT89862.1 NanoRNase/pAp phosphatase [Pseudobythopirellula maris]
MPLDWTPLKELVASCDSFVLTSHMRPDCDAIGSEIGLALALETLGKRVRIVNGDTTPPHIAFIDPQTKVETLGQGVTPEEVHQADAHIVLDTSAWGQLGPMADVLRESGAKKLVIDHHLSGDDLGGAVIKDTTAEAVGRLVAEAIDALGVELTTEMAKPLFAAIATDTGWFRFSSVTAATYETVARLVEAGANPAETFSTLFDRNTIERVWLQGRVLQSIRTELDGRVAFGHATAEDFAETGAAPADTEDVVNRLLSISGVEVAVLLTWMPEDGKTKASLRSRSDFDVREVAEVFGGGGHAKAAGVRIPGPIPEAKAALLAELVSRMA